MLATDFDYECCRLPKFLAAPLIVPNGDAKAHTNKRRAAAFAAVHQKPITWSQAKDT